MNTDFLKNLTKIQKMGALGLILVLLVVIFVWLIFVPRNNKIRVLHEDIKKLDLDINVKRAKASKLEELKKENKRLEMELAQKQKQLPAEAEVASLLKQVSDLGLRAGLDFRLWRPTSKKPGPEGLYTEIPVDVEIGGEYHTIALFFDSVRGLSRIVNIQNINMTVGGKGGSKGKRGRTSIKTTFSAVAFTAAEPEENKAGKGKAGAKGKGKPKPKPKAKPSGGGHSVPE